MNVSEVIRSIENLAEGDYVAVQTDSENEFSGKVIDKRHKSDAEHKDWILRSPEGAKYTLQVWYDPEGGPTHAQIAFKDQSTENVVAIL